MSTKQKNTIFIVDDDEIYRFAVCRQIKRINVPTQVLTFQNGLEAIHFLKASEAPSFCIPDILLLDINMPIMDGWEFLEALAEMKELAEKIRLYIVSSSINPKDKRRALNHEFVTNYIIKPIPQEELSKIIF